MDFTAFFWSPVLLAFGGCSPQNLAAAKGEQDIPVHQILTRNHEEESDGKA